MIHGHLLDPGIRCITLRASFSLPLLRLQYMLPNREYVPTSSEILYHYCSPETFLAICTGKSLRLSDLAAMNDFMEMRWGYQMWERAAKEVSDITGQELLDDIGEILSDMRILTVPLASCFSTHGDILSQWRAYAADGVGYSIGFRGADLGQLAAQMLRVSYDEAQQLSELKELIRSIHSVEEEETEKRGEGFKNICFRLAWDLAAFKNPAFSEESEVRLVHVIGHKPSNKTAKLEDGGGGAFGKPLPPQQVKFRMKGSMPVPYIDFDFSDEGRVAPIFEVKLGPKNDANPLSISIFLESLGLPNVEVTRSNASYR